MLEIHAGVDDFMLIRASNTDHVWQYRYFGIGKNHYQYTGIDNGISLNFREGSPGRRRGQNEPVRQRGGITPQRDGLGCRARMKYLPSSLRNQPKLAQLPTSTGCLNNQRSTATAIQR